MHAQAFTISHGKVRGFSVQHMAIVQVVSGNATANRENNISVHSQNIVSEFLMQRDIRICRKHVARNENRNDHFCSKSSGQISELVIVIIVIVIIIVMIIIVIVIMIIVIRCGATHSSASGLRWNAHFSFRTLCLRPKAFEIG